MQDKKLQQCKQGIMRCDQREAGADSFFILDVCADLVAEGKICGT
jgi:hypothetical protein